MFEDNPIRVFATHNFEESDDYLRVFEFLESVDRFYYLNVSKPENLPTTGGAQEIKDELIRQIKESEAMFVLASAYAQNPELSHFMMDVAEANKIGMIAIKPFGGRYHGALPGTHRVERSGDGRCPQAPGKGRGYGSLGGHRLPRIRRKRAY